MSHSVTYLKKKKEKKKSISFPCSQIYRECKTLFSTLPQQIFSSYKLGKTIRVMGFGYIISLDDMFSLLLQLSIH